MKYSDLTIMEVYQDSNPSNGHHGPSRYKMSSYKFRDSQYKDKMVSWPSYLYDINPHSWKHVFTMKQSPGNMPYFHFHMTFDHME